MGVSDRLKEIEDEMERLTTKLRLELMDKEGQYDTEWQDYTSGHLVRTEEHAVGIAKALNLNQETTNLIKWAAGLHDAGKVYIPNGILFNKIERGNEEEWKYIWRHPYDGLKWLKKNTDIEVPEEIKHAIMRHHENWDGTGYPGGRKEGQIRARIRFEARIIRVADSWDAATSDRPYKNARNIENALKKMKEKSGKVYEPTMVYNLFKYLKRKGVISKF